MENDRRINGQTFDSGHIVETIIMNIESGENWYDIIMPEDAMELGQSLEIQPEGSKVNAADVVAAIINNPDLIKDPGMRCAGFEAGLILNRQILRASGLSKEQIAIEEVKIRESIMARNGMLGFMRGRYDVYIGMQERANQQSEAISSGSNPEASVEA